MKINNVIAKLDSPNEELFQEINNPANEIYLDDVIDSIIKFRKKFYGKLSIQTMFIKKNAIYADELADIISEIKPDEVQINTPLRSCSEKPLYKKELYKIESIFKKRNLKTNIVYNRKKYKISSINKNEIIKRRGTIY